MNKNQLYRVLDTFNDRTVSHHRTVDAAVRSEAKFLRAVRRSNGQSSYIPTRIEVREDAAGEWVAADWDDVTNARLANVR